MEVLHRFYLNVVNEAGQRKLNPILYGYTIDEDIAEIFLKTRKEELFTHFSSEVTKDELLDFEHMYYKQRLEKCPFISRSSMNDCKICKVSIVATMDEYERVILMDDNLYMQMKLPDHMIDVPQIFTLEVNKALLGLGFFNIYRWLYNLGMIYKPLDDAYYAGVATIGDESVKDFQDVYFDQLEVFMHLYGNTLKD